MENDSYAIFKKEVDLYMTLKEKVTEEIVKSVEFKSLFPTKEGEKQWAKVLAQRILGIVYTDILKSFDKPVKEVKL